MSAADIDPNEPRKERICAVVVTFHPDTNLVDRVTRVLPQVGHVVVVDNGSNAEESTVIKSAASFDNVHLVELGRNMGAPFALNCGMQWAQEHGYQWLLTLDQDTIVRDNMISEMILAHRNASQSRQLAVIGCNWIDKNHQTPIYPVADGQPGDWMDVKVCITSGSLVSLSAAQAIDGFRDDFFIDQTDSDYCLRARTKGFSVILCKTPLMEHTISVPLEIRFLWKRLFLPNSPPVRHYYLTRNLTALAREYWLKETAWVIGAAKTRSKEILLVILFEPDKLAKLRMTALGLLHGLLKKLGPYPRL